MVRGGSPRLYEGPLILRSNIRFETGQKWDAMMTLAFTALGRIGLASRPAKTGPGVIR